MSNTKPRVGIEDLASVNPALTREWDAEKNFPLTPQMVYPQSNKKVWWRCPQGHSYEAYISKRTNGSGCAFCKNKAVLAGFNDLKSQDPALASEWSSRNAFTAEEVTWGSNKKVFWLCKNGHEWESSVSSRKNGNGCPVCINQLTVPGINDLATLYPGIAKEWDFSKNGSLEPSQISPGTPKKAWFICDKGHSYRTQVNNKTRLGTRCPTCAGNRIESGFNDLYTLNPELSTEFDLEKNFPLLPNQVGIGSSFKVWWKCTSGHSYQMTANGRKRGRNCPICSNRQVLVGFNDLSTTHPQFLERWDGAKNLGLQPTDFTWGSKKEVWWKCSNGHSYLRSIAQETRGSDCPVCVNKVVLKGANDLGTLYPDVAKAWDFTKNLELTPSQVLASSHARAWWICDLGHSWRASIGNRTVRGLGCPVCSNQVLAPGINDLETVDPELSAQWHPTRNGKLYPRDFQAGSMEKAWWVCSNGHEWKSSIANRHRLGVGCPTCSAGGFSVAMPALLYFIEHKAHGAMKIGVTNLGIKTNRLSAFQKAGWRVLATYTREDGQIILDAETSLLRWVRRDRQLPPYLGDEEMRPTGGASETFAGDALPIALVKARIEETLLVLDQSTKLN